MGIVYDPTDSGKGRDDRAGGGPTGLSPLSTPLRTHWFMQDTQNERSPGHRSHGVVIDPGPAADAAQVPGEGRRMPALDGLRGLAALVVLFSHFAPEAPVDTATACFKE